MSLAPPARALEEYLNLDTELEVGTFHYGLDDGQPNWLGQRALVRMRPIERIAGQLEFVNVRRGQSDYGQLFGLALWADLTRHFFTVANVSGSHGAEAFFPEWRSELDLHFKIPRLEQLVLFGGGGRVEFDDGGSWIQNAGVTWHHDWLGGGNFTYSFKHFDTDYANSSTRASSGDGYAHLGEVSLGREDSLPGRWQVRYLYGTDLLHNFSSTVRREELESHNVYFGWRRRWTRRFGTDIQLEWGQQKGVYDQRLGGELRLVWYFGNQLDWFRRDQLARGGKGGPGGAALAAR